eukprot:TRINITY_DN345_c0_g2_i1.p1 TRINITY_DN345_c0_g2~~TRINITY_DN345_c0_g2_i1.p1  ORF type:complete len:181 (+),score=35.13 TRINITY_DN345_c0_g2_i1:39-545(+)
MAYYFPAASQTYLATPAVPSFSYGTASFGASPFVSTGAFPAAAYQTVQAAPAAFPAAFAYNPAASASPQFQAQRAFGFEQAAAPATPQPAFQQAPPAPRRVAPSPTHLANDMMVRQYRKKGNKHLTVWEAQNIDLAAHKRWNEQIQSQQQHQQPFFVAPPTEAPAAYQ